MNPEKLTVAAKTCTDGGLSDCSHLLTNLASGGVVVFMVLECLGYDDGERGGLISGRGHPLPKVYLTRDAADAAATLKNAQSIPHFCPFTFCYDPEDVMTVTIAEFEESVSEILGKKFKMPDDIGRKYSGPVFSRKLSDAQLLMISKMLRIELHEVKEVSLVG